MTVCDGYSKLVLYSYLKHYLILDTLGLEIVTWVRLRMRQVILTGSHPRLRMCVFQTPKDYVSCI